MGMLQTGITALPYSSEWFQDNLSFQFNCSFSSTTSFYKSSEISRLLSITWEEIKKKKNQPTEKKPKQQMNQNSYIERGKWMPSTEIWSSSQCKSINSCINMPFGKYAWYYSKQLIKLSIFNALWKIKNMKFLIAQFFLFNIKAIRHSWLFLFFFCLHVTMNTSNNLSTSYEKKDKIYTTIFSDTDL